MERIQFNGGGQIATDDEISRANATPAPEWGSFDEGGDRRPRIEPQIRVGGTGHRVTVTGNGGMTTESYNTLSNERGGVGPLTTTKSVVETAQSASGGYRPPHMLRPSDTVEVDGMRTSVANAERMGLIKRDAAGGYVDAVASRPGVPSPQSRTTGEEQSRRSPEPQRELSELEKVERELAGDYEPETLADRNIESLNEAIINAVDAHIIERGLQEAVEYGEFSDQTIGEVATKLGMTEDQALKAVEAMQSAYADQLSRGLSSAGLGDADLQQEFLGWLAETNPSEEKAARRALAERSTAKGYAKHVNAFVASLGKDDPHGAVEAARRSGVEARVVEGQAVLTLPGLGEMSWQNAIKNGFVRLRG